MLSAGTGGGGGIQKSPFSHPLIAPPRPTQPTPVLYFSSVAKAASDRRTDCTQAPLKGVGMPGKRQQSPQVGWALGQRPESSSSETSSSLRLVQDRHRHPPCHQSCNDFSLSVVAPDVCREALAAFNLFSLSACETVFTPSSRPPGRVSLAEAASN